MSNITSYYNITDGEDGIANDDIGGTIAVVFVIGLIICFCWRPCTEDTGDTSEAAARRARNRQAAKRASANGLDIV